MLDKRKRFPHAERVQPRVIGWIHNSNLDLHIQGLRSPLMV